MKLKQSESDIQKQIVDYLSAIARRYNFFFFSIPNEGMMLTGMIAGMTRKILSIILNHLKKMGLIPGVPDLCILWNSKTIFIEVKKPGESPTENQERIHEAIRYTGHHVWTVCNVETVKFILENEGVIK